MHEKIIINIRCEAVDAIVGIFWSKQYYIQIVNHLNKPTVINIESKSARKIKSDKQCEQ